MAEAQHQELTERYRKSYVARIRRSLTDLKEGRIHHIFAKTLIDELHLES
ncbi:MAG TPA: hypothetical protein VF443_10180 [Nitrospira sp.]